MEELDTDDSALPIASAKEPANPEMASVKRVLTLLDKTAKSSRTYGTANPVAQKFFQQLFEGLTTHLATYSKLAFLVQRSELYFNGEVVYRSEQDSSNESVAFKLYADGIRELAFLEGLAAEDLSFLLDSFGTASIPKKVTTILSLVCGPRTSPASPWSPLKKSPKPPRVRMSIRNLQPKGKMSFLCLRPG
jgi:hypothetical protein